MLVQILYVVLGLIIAFLIFWKFWFLRDPKREIPSGKVVVAPCDGKVVKVLPFNQKQLRVKKGLFGKIRTLASDVGKEGTLVSIFMSPIDVHVTRSPIAGKVLSLHHEDGKFLPVFTLEAGLENEKLEILMKNRTVGKFKVILMAGFLARRIVSYVDEGTVLETGQRNGLINLGSQVTVLFPKKVKIHISEGERVYAGSTVIGSY